MLSFLLKCEWPNDIIFVIYAEDVYKARKIVLSNGYHGDGYNFKNRDGQLFTILYSYPLFKIKHTLLPELKMNIRLGTSCPPSDDLGEKGSEGGVIK